jgi:hypothetical protein
MTPDVASLAGLAIAIKVLSPPRVGRSARKLAIQLRRTDPPLT